MSVVRTWLPAAIILAGIVLAAATGGSDTGLEGAALMVSAGASVWLINFLYRVGVKGDRERDAEDRARDYYDKHGRWPEDERHERRSDDTEAVDSGDDERRRR